MSVRNGGGRGGNGGRNGVGLPGGNGARQSEEGWERVLRGCNGVRESMAKGKACSMIATHCEALAPAFLGRPTIPATLPDSFSPPKTCHHYLTAICIWFSRNTPVSVAAVHQEFVASLWCALCIDERRVGGVESIPRFWLGVVLVRFGGFVFGWGGELP